MPNSYRLLNGETRGNVQLHSVDCTRSVVLMSEKFADKPKSTDRDERAEATNLKRRKAKGCLVPPKRTIPTLSCVIHP